MRFIVSPAKKMNVAADVLPWRDLPRFVDQAALLADEMRALSLDEAKALWRCSDALAELNHERFRTMDVRDGALVPAIFAYEGIQYQHMAPQVMTADQLEYVQEHLRIVSGLYGVLRPFDGVMPYRLEMQAKFAVQDAHDLYHFWGDSLYRALAEEAKVIVNLASVEYAKAIVSSVQRAAGDASAGGLPVVTCLFGTLDARDRFVQRATAAKAARGSMVRWCAENNVQSVDDLRKFDVAGYAYDPDRSDEAHLVFVA